MVRLGKVWRLSQQLIVIQGWNVSGQNTNMGKLLFLSQSFWKFSLAARCTLLTRLCLLQQVSLKAGRNLITFQATGITYGAVEKREPVYIKSIQVQGNARA